MQDLTKLARKLDAVERELKHELRHDKPATIGQLNATALELGKMLNQLTTAVQELQEHARNSGS